MGARHGLITCNSELVHLQEGAGRPSQYLVETVGVCTVFGGYLEATMKHIVQIRGSTPFQTL